MSSAMRMQISLEPRGRVHATCEVALPLSAVAVWGQMRDFAGFCTMDPLHRRVLMRHRANSPSSADSPRGAELVISHRLLGIGPDRVGRVLTWREGRGYAFSDLSRRGRNTGFPHICWYDLRPAGDDCSVLTIGARGIWTARVVPPVFVRWWLGFVLRETARGIRRRMRTLRRWKAMQVRSAAGG